MTGLRIALLLVWLVAQALGLLVGGWALLGFQNGQASTGLLGILLLIGPAIVAGGAWWLSAKAADPAGATPILLAAIVILIVGTGVLLVTVGGAPGA